MFLCVLVRHLEWCEKHWVLLEVEILSHLAGSVARGAWGLELLCDTREELVTLVGSGTCAFVFPLSLKSCVFLNKLLTSQGPLYVMSLFLCCKNNAMCNIVLNTGVWLFICEELGNDASNPWFILEAINTNVAKKKP